MSDVPTHRETWLAAIIGLIGLMVLVSYGDHMVADLLAGATEAGAQLFSSRWWFEACLRLLFIMVGVALIWSAATLAWLLVLRPSERVVQVTAVVLTFSIYFFVCFFVSTYILTADDAAPAGVKSWSAGAAVVCAGPALVFGTTWLAWWIGRAREDWRNASTIRGLFLWVGWTSFLFLPSPGHDWGAGLLPHWPEHQVFFVGFCAWIFFLVIFTKLGWRVTLRLLGIERPPDFPRAPRRSFRIA